MLILVNGYNVNDLPLAEPLGLEVWLPLEVDFIWPGMLEDSVANYQRCTSTLSDLHILCTRLPMRLPPIWLLSFKIKLDNEVLPGEGYSSK